MTLFPAILSGLKEKGADDKLLFGGGIIADADTKKLHDMGIGRIFTPGATSDEIIQYLNENLKERKENLL